MPKKALLAKDIFKAMCVRVRLTGDDAANLRKAKLSAATAAAAAAASGTAAAPGAAAAGSTASNPNTADH